MAARTFTFAQWFKLVTRHPLGDEFANLAGHPVADVARTLNVSPQRVHQLISDDVLDTIAVTNLGGTRVALLLVTEASVERYLNERVPDRHRQGYFAFPK
jgi:hypothetical protein